MKCPDEVLNAVINIIEITLLRIRNANKQNADYYLIEADHIHNLPDLLRNYSEELLKYYLEVERPIYMKNSLDKNFHRFEPYWNKLEDTLSRKI